MADQSLVRKAAQAFRRQDYVVALQHYERLAQILGPHLFAANIALCRRSMASVASAGSEFAASLPVSDGTLKLSLKPAWRHAAVKPDGEVRVRARVNSANSKEKSAVVLVKVLDAEGDVIPAEEIDLPYSKILQASFRYLPHSGDRRSEILCFKAPRKAATLKLGFCLFKPDAETQIEVSDLQIHESPPKAVSVATDRAGQVPGPKAPSEFKVAMIADEFTANSFSSEFQAVHLEPDNWQAQFEEHQPEIFFCESAWSGPDSQRRPWKGKVYASCNFAKENRGSLLAILRHCRERGIPTVFWNKEDPTHHDDRRHDFVTTAKEFDFVFTTAEECVDSYKQVYGVPHAFPLPFATNPRLFNPMEEAAQRSSSIVFAGSWYGNHENRCRAMGEILDHLLESGFDLEIYNRYHGDNDPLHKWPEKYERYLRPGQPHDRMPAIYKSSRLGLNFNTVTESPTMFARRVFELMSCNTLVVSNYSLGTDRMFGDLIVYADRAKDRLCSLTPAEVEELRRRALRKVLREHTYANRWSTILEGIGVPHQAKPDTFTIAVVVHHGREAQEAIAWFQRNATKLNGARLLLVAALAMPGLEVADLYRKFNRFGVTVTAARHAALYALEGRYQPVETSHFLAVDLAKPPPRDWIHDATMHLSYSGLPVAAAANSEDTFRTGPARHPTALLDKASAFEKWLKRKGQPIDAYFV